MKEELLTASNIVRYCERPETDWRGGIAGRRIMSHMRAGGG